MSSLILSAEEEATKIQKSRLLLRGRLKFNGL